jgi:hypothetical protein
MGLGAASATALGPAVLLVLLTVAVLVVLMVLLVWLAVVFWCCSLLPLGGC